MGRMLAELPGAEVDGAVQFAHAFTTHGTQVETDFFTAVDDIEKEGDAGSAHMNSAQYSAGTFYRYANVGLSTLADNLDGDLDTARELTAEFLRAFVMTVPTGKQNATAAMTIPDLVYVAIRDGRPVSFAPAFEDPVRSELGFGTPSGERFAAYAAQLNQYWGTSDLIRHGHASIWGKSAASLGEHAASIDDLLAASVAAAFPSPSQP
jgi:CRISPR system Cascade subunit CasC